MKMTEPQFDFIATSRELEKHHAVFYQLWQMGSPVFTEEIDTACVTFDDEGENVGFLWNPKFFESLTEYQRLFVTCHECLHVILNHGIRLRGFKSADMDGANIALDVVVIFERDKLLPFGKNACWLDTVFKNRDDVKPDETFEYYYNRLDKKELNFDIIDIHGFGDLDFGGVIDALNEALSDEEKESLKGLIDKHFEANNQTGGGRGIGAGGQWYFASTRKVAKKKKWETVIKKWSLQFKPKPRQAEQWARINRRFALLSDDLLLPSEMEEEQIKDPDRIEVWFFQDTSGSCSRFRDRFFTAAKTLPEDRFDVKMHCFDDRVYETSLESGKLFGFGGTSFHILENYIQNYCKQHDKKYPSAVFVITDGYGTNVNPQHPKNWHWFLSTRATHCIHKECNIYRLSDFE